MAYKKICAIVVDDSMLDCFIAERVLKDTNKFETIRTFQSGNEAIEFIAKAPTEDDAKTLLLVDIRMPKMDGFEFIQQFDTLPQNIKNAYAIFLVNSSINDRDLARVKEYSSIKLMVNKPISLQAVEQLLRIVQGN